MFAHRSKTFLIACMVAALSLMTSLAHAQNLNPDFVKKIDDALPAKATVKPSKQHKVLIYTFAAGFVHSSIPYGAYAVEAMGKKTGAYTSVTSSDPAVFDDLKGYDAIVMVNTTGDWLMPRNPGGEPKNDPNKPDPNYEAKLAAWKAAKAQYDADSKNAKEKVESRRKNLLDFLAAGGGLAGFHAASDAQYNWKEFGLIIGGYFWGHPWHEKVGIKLEDPKHPLLKTFEGQDFAITDEIYQFKEPYSRGNLRILLRLDTSKTNMKKGGINRKDDDFGVAWIRDYEKGHIFYSSLGHREEIYWNPAIMQFYLDGIQFALGDLKADATPSDKKAAAATESSSSSSAIATADSSDKSDKSDKKILFDGKSLDGWTFNKDGWVIEDGAMSLVKGGGYIWTKETYGDFELDLDFKVSKGCNSGIFFRTNPKNPVSEGFEIQVMDSHGKKPDKHSVGSLYDAQAASKTTVNPAGEWNTYKMICKGPKITIFINGEKINEADLDQWTQANKNPDGTKNKFPTALKDMPRTGHIGFQDHGQPVWYRNVTIKTP